MNALRYTLLLALGAAATLSAGATDVTTAKAGTLSTLVSAPETETSLAVTGPIDASDLTFIAEKMPSLATLDLGAATIEAYQGDAWDGLSASPALTLPSLTLSGSVVTAVTLPRQSGLVVAPGAFCGSAVTTLTLPQVPCRIGEGAFAGCTSLTEVVIPSMATLEANAFAQCTSLAKVTLDNVAEIGQAAFSGCTALAEVEGAANVTAIGARAFEGCESLTAFAFGTGLTTIGAEAFAHTAMSDVDLAQCQRLTDIGAMAFAHCPSLTRAALPGHLATLGMGIFFADAALYDLVLPDNLTAIPDYALSGDRLLAHEQLPNLPITSIGKYALKDNAAATDLKLPATLSRLDDGAMEGMDGLTSIDVLEIEDHYPPALGNDVWAGLDKVKIMLKVYDDKAQAYKDADQWREFTQDITTASRDIELPATATDVRGRWHGTDLVVSSQSQPIDRVVVYDPAGRLLVAADPYANDIAIDTSDMDTRIFLVSVTLADGAKASIKMGR